MTASVEGRYRGASRIGRCVATRRQFRNLPRLPISIRSSVMRRLAFALVFLTACTHPQPGPAAPMYDVVITGGRIVDGSGNPWFYGDVGISGDRIIRVAPSGALADAAAGRRIDARGLVVAPGFIDIQAQSYEAHLIGDGRVISKIAQGVTT